MSAFGPRAVETLARLLWAFDRDDLDLYVAGSDDTHELFAALSPGDQDEFRACAAVALTLVAAANREHLTDRVMAAQGRYFDESVALSDRELAEYVVRGVYGS